MITTSDLKRYRKVADDVLTQYAVALADKKIEKPLSWALYEVWKKTDAQEKPRKGTEG